MILKINTRLVQSWKIQLKNQFYRNIKQHHLHKKKIWRQKSFHRRTKNFQTFPLHLPYKRLNFDWVLFYDYFFLFLLHFEIRSLQTQKTIFFLLFSYLRLKLRNYKWSIEMDKIFFSLNLTSNLNLTSEKNVTDSRKFEEYLNKMKNYIIKTRRIKTNNSKSIRFTLNSPFPIPINRKLNSLFDQKSFHNLSYNFQRIFLSRLRVLSQYFDIPQAQ